jgi:hypothetical protein
LDLPIALTSTDGCQPPPEPPPCSKSGGRTQERDTRIQSRKDRERDAWA